MRRPLLLTVNEKQLLSEVLWDTDLDKIDKFKKKFAVIERIISYGRPEHVRWMIKNYEEKDIADVIRRSKNINKKTRNYWGLRLNIPIKNLCITKQSAMK